MVGKTSFAWALSILAFGSSQAAIASDSHLSCLVSDLRGTETQKSHYVEVLHKTSTSFGIAPEILVAIKRTESGLSLNPSVKNNNRNRTTDRGLHQVNFDVWHPVTKELGLNLSADDFHDVYSNSILAGWVLKRQMERFKNDMYKAVGHYHKGGGSDQYSRDIRQTYMSKFMPHLRALLSRCS